MDEITLFDVTGRPTAYLSVQHDNTIYLWSGEPVAYLHGEHVYSFNGRHLGWFESGVLWDHSGYRAGFVRSTLPVYAQFEPFKSFKQFKPFKSFREFAPFKPFRSTSSSRAPLSVLLVGGR
ncbi:MAG TPA: hypothetical protein VE842_14620 [Pyrinomonadaceae bacterium]|nr:hypothetical protein [Pyrinomonadaceae bacterium]